MRYLKLTTTPIQDINKQLSNTNLTDINKAQLLFDSGNLQKAQQLFNQLKQQSKNTKVQIGLLYIALAQNNIDQAEYLIQKLLLKDNTHQTDALIDSARITLNILKQNFSKAISLIENKIKQGNSTISDYLILADLDIYSGDYKKALNTLDMGLQRYPQGAQLYAKKAKIYLISDNTQQATRNVRERFKT